MQVTENPHFETVPSWKAARAMLTFEPRAPCYTAGLRLHSLRVHVRDHKLRMLSVSERILEAHYGAFVLSQARRGGGEARRLALAVPYGSGGRDGRIAGRPARIYELGSEPEPDDIDGRSPAVVAWHDADLFCLVASATMASDKLVRIAGSLYGRLAKGAKASMDPKTAARVRPPASGARRLGLGQHPSRRS
jgi:hypothetical protein